MAIEEPWKKSSGSKPWRAITYEVDENGCHVCTSHRPSGQGYPRIRRDGRLLQLHRYIYTKYKGHIPDGYCVMHMCDNRMCINPDHLEAGTLAENNIDMFDKGRGKVPTPPRGEDNPTSKLTEEQVLKIRKDGVFTAARAREYGIAKSTIYNIRDRKIWSHI